MTGESIGELISKASGDTDSVAAYAAARNLLQRRDECIPHVDAIVHLLQHENAPIADLAFRILERIGAPCSQAVVNALDGATGRYRSYLFSLLTHVAEFGTYFPILELELQDGDEAMRFQAANCLGRSFDAKNPWPRPAMKTLDQCVELLYSCRANPDLLEYWLQARMTLKQLGHNVLDAHKNTNSD